MTSTAAAILRMRRGQSRHSIHRDARLYAWGWLQPPAAVPIRRLVRPWWWVDAEPVSAIVLANVAEFAHAIHVHNQVGPGRYCSSLRYR